MPFHIRDPETDALVRELARKRGQGLTEAVKTAVGAELRREVAGVPFAERLRALQDKALSRPETGLAADKAFYDELSGGES
jgi:antitoxin VapB